MKTTGIIHVYAECDDSPYPTQNHTTGRRNESPHHGHLVNIDAGTIEIVDHRKEAP